jgi:hypothetical protein
LTICVSIKVRDGLVLATDSMSQITGASASGQVEVWQTYTNARKLFQVGDLPMGVMTYGAGNIGDKSIQGLVNDFQQEKPGTTVEEVAVSLFAFINDAYEAYHGSSPPEQRPGLGLYVAGYSGQKGFAEEWEFYLPVDQKPLAVRPETTFGSSWRGIEGPISRLYKGCDPYIWHALDAAGLESGVIDKVMEVVQGFEAQIVYAGMPVQDAINLAAYLLRTTIGYDFFQIGVPSCGGPLQVGVILPDEGFRWVEKPGFFVDTM